MEDINNSNDDRKKVEEILDKYGDALIDIVEKAKKEMKEDALDFFLKSSREDQLEMTSLYTVNRFRFGDKSAGKLHVRLLPFIKKVGKDTCK